MAELCFEPAILTGVAAGAAKRPLAYGYAASGYMLFQRHGIRGIGYIGNINVSNIGDVVDDMELCGQPHVAGQYNLPGRPGGHVRAVNVDGLAAQRSAVRERNYQLYADGAVYLSERCTILLFWLPCMRRP